MAQFLGASSSIHYSRRKFLLKSSALVLATTASPSLLAKASTAETKTLSFLNLHTNESLQCSYCIDGQQNLQALKKINHILRDHRSGETAQIDVQLLDLLHQLQLRTGSSAPFEIISGYRSPKTNESLRKSSTGVAKRSLHMQGKAIDIRLPDIALKTLRDQAIELQAGGVGYYAKSGFIHIDTGTPRRW